MKEGLKLVRYASYPRASSQEMSGRCQEWAPRGDAGWPGSAGDRGADALRQRLGNCWERKPVVSNARKSQHRMTDVPPWRV